MNAFVEECRREWKRLGVPDPLADEMAAELTADLEEAEAEGASAEDVLGSGAFDPRSFAAAWAAERGVIQRPPPTGHEHLRGTRLVAAIGVFALIAGIGGVLVIVASPAGPTRLALTAPVDPPRPARMVHVPPPSAAGDPWAAVIQGVTFQVLAPPPMPGARIVAVDIEDSGVDTRTVGSVLLIVGLAGLMALTLFWLWVGPGRWPRRRTHIDDRLSGPAY